MKIKVEKILDYLFNLSIIAMIIMPSSVVGKAIQLFFMFAVLVLIGYKKIVITKFNILDFAFLGYTIFQFIVGISVLRDSSLNASQTILYNSLYSISIINYLIIKNNFVSFCESYAKTTLFSLIFLFIIYGINYSSMRFDTKNIIFFIGGHSATSLSIIAAIPCFFLILSEKKERKMSNYLIVGLLFLISLSTGTRKTLILFAYIFLFMIPLGKKDISFTRLLKNSIYSLIIIAVFILLCFKVPVLYNVMGQRIEGVFNSFNTETEKISDDSIRVRERMINQAKNLYEQKKLTGWGMDYFRASSQNDLGYYSHNNNKNLCIFLFLFLLIMLLLETWQVTYLYRYILIYQSIIIYIIYKYNNKKREGKKHED